MKVTNRLGVFIIQDDGTLQLSDSFDTAHELNDGLKETEGAFVVLPVVEQEILPEAPGITPVNLDPKKIQKKGKAAKA